MASRRKLKKTIRFVCNELITEVYFRCLLNNKIDETTANNLVINIVDISKEFTLRANRPAGKENRSIVKTYYRSLYSSWNQKVAETLKEIELI